MSTRAHRVDLSDVDAAVVCREHIKLVNVAQDLLSLWKYRAKGWKCGPCWSDLHRQRFFLHDLLAATGGRQLRQKGFETQLHVFLQKHNVEASLDQISVVCHRARMMLSHVLRIRRQGSKVPRAYQSSLCSLVQMARVAPQGDGDPDDEDPDGDSASDVECIVPAAPKVEKINVSSDDDAGVDAAPKADVDAVLDFLSSKLFDNEAVVTRQVAQFLAYSGAKNCSSIIYCLMLKSVSYFWL